MTSLVHRYNKNGKDAGTESWGLRTESRRAWVGRVQKGRIEKVKQEYKKDFPSRILKMQKE